MIGFLSEFLLFTFAALAEKYLDPLYMATCVILGVYKPTNIHALLGELVRGRPAVVSRLEMQDGIIVPSFKVTSEK